jgi:hypothetical protein
VVIDVRVTDPQGAKSVNDAKVTITLTNAQEAPYFTSETLLKAFTVGEDAAEDAAVAGSPILAADADAGDDRTTDLSAYED